MTIQIPKGYDRIYYSVVLMYIVEFTNALDRLNVVNLALPRYLLATLATWFLVSGVWQTRSRKLVRSKLLFMFYAFCLLLWTGAIIMRGAPQLFSSFQGFVFFKQFISGAFFIYLIPILMFSLPSLYLYRRLMKMAYVCGILFLMLGIPLFGYFTSYIVMKSPNGISGESLGVVLAAGVSIIALTFSYHGKRANLVTWLTILLVLVMNGLLARRNQLVYFGSVIFFSFYLSTFTSSPIIRSRKAMNLLAVAFVLLMLISSLPVIGPQFSLVVERFSTGFDSREGVVDEFVADFDRSPIDWVIGRGIYGTFESATLATFESGERDVIENGYLYLILKGGGLYLGLIIILGFVAMFKGFFRSKNLLCKAFALIILIHFLDMVGFGLPSYYLKYIFFWLGIGACFSKSMRTMSDHEIASTLSLK